MRTGPIPFDRIAPALALCILVLAPRLASALPKADPNEKPLSAQDSAAARDPFLAPPPGSAPDSSAAAPMQEAVNLSPQGYFTNTTPRVGDSLDYIVAVEWQDTQVPVVVLAPDSVDFPGFKVLGQSTQHKKLANGTVVKNHTEYQYHLRAFTQGPGKAISLKLRFLTGLSQREEAVFVPSALVDIAAAPTRLMDMLWFKALMCVAIFGSAVAIGRAAYRASKNKRAAAQPKREDLRPDADALKTRLRSAQNTPDASKAILLEMESICGRFFRDALSASKTGLPPKFDAQLDAYLALSDAARGADAGSPAEWARLKDAFRHARFAGGYMEPHELQDIYRTFRKCLKLTGAEHD